MTFEIWIGKQGITRCDVNPHAAFTWRIHNIDATPALERHVHCWMEHYLSRQEYLLPPIDLSQQTPFTARVLSHLANIPFGETCTYGAVAKQLGNPQASRAVGAACGRNQVLVFLPCHRVVGAGGALGGFTMGLEIKRRLLVHEGVQFASATGN